MNNYISIMLKMMRKFYFIINRRKELSGRIQESFPLKDYSNELIYRKLVSDSPCMIARFGATELNALVNYLGVSSKDRSILKYVTGKKREWWWLNSVRRNMSIWSGFFPSTDENLEKFCKLMVNDMHEIDILGSWLNGEKYFNNELSIVKRVVLEDLEPFFATNPWTKALEGKKVLVIHPFAETIEMQYKKRKLLFDNDLLPEFDLKVLKAVQSIAGTETEFKDWFEALEFMKNSISKIDFDIAIIGCGAYGFPLAAFIKRLGKKAFHLGGVTQLLFGIKGRRWVDSPLLYYPYANLFNDNWIYPLDEDKPAGAKKVEDACYW